MTGYGLPGAPAALLATAFAAAAAALGPLLAQARPARWQRWLGRSLVLLALVLGPLLTGSEPAGTRMWLLCACVFLAMKVLVQAEARGRGKPVPTGGAWLCFAFLWPGMRPWTFAGPRVATRGGARWIARGVAFTLLGVGLLLAAHAGLEAAFPELVVAFVALAGAGLVIAFGAFQVLAGFWRLLGRPVAPLFDAPARSRSLEELWSRRWNRAFSEMLQLTIERPLRRRFTRPVAWGACFLASGLLHELALSVPARAGYGLPTLYFALQGLLVAVERRLSWPSGAGGVLVRRAWTLGLVLLPLPLVFHAPALRALVLPVVGGP
jgi:alginate O-acetyltransferase complex protein AlgI